MAHLRSNGALSSNVLYRGQTNVDWKLVPALYRRDVHIFGPAPVESRYLTAEQNMLNGFFDRALLLLPNFSRTELIERIVAQHYGVPTQLLDWTLDPFIALFFAVHGGDPTTDASLYYLQPLTVADVRAPLSLPFTNRLTRIRPPIVDERVRAQKSAFTIQSFGGADRFVPLDDRALKFSGPYDGTDPRDEVAVIGKVVIPSKQKQQIQFDLLQLGIDSALMFPGLQGIGQRVADIASIQSYGGWSEY